MGLFRKDVAPEIAVLDAVRSWVEWDKRRKTDKTWWDRTVAASKARAASKRTLKAGQKLAPHSSWKPPAQKPQLSPEAIAQTAASGTAAVFQPKGGLISDLRWRPGR